MGPVLCLITNRARYESDDHLVAVVADAASAGVQLVQVRERTLDANALCELVRRLVAAVAGTRTRIVVNDRVDVAVAAGAHGVHLPGSGVPAARVRAIVPRQSGFLVGRSVHSADEAAIAAADGGLDYLVFGTVFTSPSKPGIAAAGTDALRQAVRAAAPIPVLAIGGVTESRFADVARAGAAGLAGISLFAEAAAGERLQHLVAHASVVFDTPGGVP